MAKSWVEQNAAKRRKRNVGSTTNQGIERDADEIGISGQEAFCIWAGVDKDMYVSTKHRNPGYFIEMNGLRVRTHTTKTPGLLLEKENRCNADIYILCHYQTGKPTSMLGWTTKEVVQSKPARSYVKDGPYKLPSHAVTRQELSKDWTELRVLLGIEVKQLSLFGDDEAPIVKDRWA